MSISGHLHDLADCYGAEKCHLAWNADHTRPADTRALDMTIDSDGKSTLAEEAVVKGGVREGEGGRYRTY